MGDDRESRVRQRAHEIWLREGQPDGHGERHWSMAEAEVDTEMTATPARKTTAKKSPASAKPASPKSGSTASAKPAAALKPKATAKKSSKAAAGK